MKKSEKLVRLEEQKELARELLVAMAGRTQGYSSAYGIASDSWYAAEEYFRQFDQRREQLEREPESA